MQRKVSYCKGVIDVNHLSYEVADVISRLEDGEDAGLCIEKLRGHNLYSCRLNQADRLLFTYVEIDGANYLLLLDIVRNHDYDKSFATKPRVLGKFLELNGRVIADSIKREDFAASNESSNEAVTNLDNNNNNNNITRKIYIPEMEFFNDQFIALSKDQLEARKAALPVTIHGAAGSGKSGAAFARLTDLAEAMNQHGGEKLPEVCYVTQSQALCDNMRENFEASPQAKLASAARISFKTYEQIVASDLKPADYETFKLFIINQIKSHKRSCKEAKSQFSDDFYQNTDAMYQELRNISAVSSLEEYLDFGNNQSLYPRQQKAQRSWLYQIRTNYLNHLKDKRMIDLGCCAAPVAERECIFLVDEAQDLSSIQLKELSRIAGRRVIYFYHKQQSLSDTLDKEHLLNEITCARDKGTKVIEMKSSFRCSSAILAVAQEFLDIGATLTGSAKTPIPSSQIDGEGTVIVMTKINENDEKELQQESATADCVIITDEAYIEDAKRRFPRANLITTVARFKGLEASSVILYRLLDNKVYETACKQLSKEGEEKKVVLVNKALAPAFNSIYTACTRVRGAGKLIIVQDNPKTLKNIQAILQRLEKHQTKNRLQSQQQLSNEKANQILFERVKELLRTNTEENRVAAKKIYLEQLHKTENEFNVMLKVYFTKETAVDEQGKAPKSYNNTSKTETKMGKSTRKNKGKREAQVDHQPTQTKPMRSATASTKLQLMSKADIVHAMKINDTQRITVFREYFKNIQYYPALFTLPSDATEECPFLEYIGCGLIAEYVFKNIDSNYWEKLFAYETFKFDTRNAYKLNDLMSIPPVFAFASIPDIWRILIATMKRKGLPLKFRDIATNHRGLSALHMLTFHDDGLLIFSELIQANIGILIGKNSDYYFTPATCLAEKRSIVDNLLDMDITKLAGAPHPLSVLCSNVKGLSYKIQLNHLIANNHRTNEPRLVTLVRTPLGKQLIKSLTSHNEELRELQLWKLEPGGAEQLCLVENNLPLLPPKVDCTDEMSREYVNNLLLNVSECDILNLMDSPFPYRFFFDVPTDNDECLFKKLMANKDICAFTLRNMISNIKKMIENNDTTTLFNTPLADGECLFVRLLEHAEIRACLLPSYIAKLFGLIKVDMPAHALVRKNRRSGKADPFIWMCANESLINTLIQSLNPALVKSLIDNQVLFRPITIQDYTAAELPQSINVLTHLEGACIIPGSKKTLQPWEMLCANKRGTELLLLIDTQSDHKVLKHPLLFFGNDLQVRSKNDETKALFHHIIHSSMGLVFLERFLNLNQSAGKQIISHNLFLSGCTVNETNRYVGDCALFDILKKTNNTEVMTLILKQPFHVLSESGLIKALLFPLTSDCTTDNDAVARFVRMIESPEILNEIETLVENNPTLSKEFDSSLFLTTPDEADIRANAIAMLKASATGNKVYRILRDNMQKALTFPASSLLAHSMYSRPMKTDTTNQTSDLPMDETIKQKSL